MSFTMLSCLPIPIHLGRRRSPPPLADRSDGSADIETADAAYGTVPPEQFVPAKKVAAMRGTDFHREAAVFSVADHGRL